MASVQDNESGHLSTYILGFSFASLGVMLGFAYMLQFEGKAVAKASDLPVPAESSAEEAEEAEDVPPIKPGDTFYVENRLSNTRNWIEARQQIVEGTASEVRLSGGDLNAWIRQRTQLLVPPEESRGILVIPGRPAFGTGRDNTFYINMSLQVSAYGLKDELKLIAQCGTEGAGIRVDSLFLNSARIPLASTLGQRLLLTLTRPFQGNEDFEIIRDAISRADSLQVSGGEFVLKLP